MAIITIDPEQDALIQQGYCGARNRNPMSRHEFCQHQAGKRTDHPGTGRCWLHGGRAQIKHGRYSEVKKDELNKLIAEHVDDPDIYNTQEEIAAARALFEDHLNRYHEFRDALFAWHESYQPGMPHKAMLDALADVLTEYEREYSNIELMNMRRYQMLKQWYNANIKANPKPVQLLDIADSYKILDAISKMVERVGKINSQNAISRKDFVRIMTEIGNIIDQSIPDDRTKQRIKSRMATLRLA